MFSERDICVCFGYLAPVEWGAMDTLPSSIESHFQEAGFSATEILIIKKLVEGDAMTLRDLAFKTGKSTGVLDQAMKKLLKKKIVLREMINGTPKYVLHSLDIVTKWLESDMQNKKRTLEMRHQNFEAFISSISAGKKRPEMQFFQGEEGMKKAYMLLLDKGNDFVQYGPTLYTETEDPLRDFRVEYFRERRKRNIFLRVMTHNNPLGRRAISRDPFEYRKTILVDENNYPFSFEKIIVGNTVACFHLETKEACFIEYAELAERERQFFERLWNLKLQRPDESEQTTHNPIAILPQKKSISLQESKSHKLFFRYQSLITYSIGIFITLEFFYLIYKKYFSIEQTNHFYFAQFLLSQKNINLLILSLSISILLTFFLYRYNFLLNQKRIQDRAKSIAATAAIQFDISDLNELRNPADIQKPQYAKVIYLLNQIRNHNEDVRFSYIMRPTEELGIWQFVADADSLDPNLKLDLNNDGVIDSADELAFPGQIYNSYLNEGYDHGKSLIEPIIISHVKNQWGNFVSSFAPIKNFNQQTVAVLGIDIFTESVSLLAKKTFKSWLYLIVIFLSSYLIFSSIMTL